jgi:hypothetical protein
MMRRFRTGAKALAALVVCCCGIPFAVATDPLVTDRPDFTESAVVVPRGELQVEAGATFERVVDSVDVVIAPEALLRWGVLNDLELRIGAPDWQDVSGRGFDDSGFGDASLGLKWQIGPLRDWDLALILETTVPTGEDGFTSDAWDPAAILVAGIDLSDSMSFGTQVGMSWESQDDDREALWQATAVVGVGLAETVGTFFEAAAYDTYDDDAAVLLHHGSTWEVRPLLQLDIHVAAGLNDAAPDWSLGAGVSSRW